MGGWVDRSNAASTALQGRRVYSKLDFAATMLASQHDSRSERGSDETKTVETVHI
jgi:hypothetical protein